MNLACICFTARGEALAQELLPSLGGWQTSLAKGYGSAKAHLGAWTKTSFESADAMLFIGAAGIAVRAAAPHVQSKTCDPAVLVMDESGRFVVPLLSGHIGGGNRLAKTLAGIVGGTAVLTTATDVRGVLAIDEWASQNGMHIQNPHRIKTVSAQLLEGKAVALFSEWPLQGTLPEGFVQAADKNCADVVISPCGEECGALQLVPRCVAVGVGCRRGTPAQSIESAFENALQTAGINAAAVLGVYSIDLKKDEPGLLEFCVKHRLPFATCSAAELQAVNGSVASSGFVQQTTGVDNVCERSALAGGGRLLLEKTAFGGVTVALALREINIGFEEIA